MPVDYDLVDQIAGNVAGIYRHAETALVELLADRLRRGLEEPDWATRRLAEVREVLRSARTVVERLDRDADPALRRAVALGYRSGSNTAVQDLAALTGSPPARRVTERNSTAVQVLADALVREVRPVHEAVLPCAERAYRQAIADATARTLTGTHHRRRAAQDAWAALVQQGITQVVDTRGRAWRLHTFVEMATRTSTARAATQGTVDTLLANGQRHVYVTDQPQECPICRPWEHKVVDLVAPATEPAVATLEAARAAGLMHPNCRHGIAPWRPSIRLSRQTADPEGHAARERQRAIERHIRAWREREAAALGPDDRAYAHRRVEGWTQHLEEHLAGHPKLTRLRYREYIGAGHIPSDRRQREQARAAAEAEREPAVPAWRTELQNVVDRLPEGRDGWGTRVWTPEDAKARRDALTAGWRKELVDLEARDELLSDLLEQVWQVRYSYPYKIKDSLARKLRAAGISTRGGHDKVWERILTVRQDDIAQRRWELESRINSADHEVNRDARAVNGVGADITGDGKLGERTAAALDGVLEAGRLLDAEIQRRLAGRGLDRAGLAARSDAAREEFHRAMSARMDLRYELEGKARRVAESALGKTYYEFTDDDLRHYEGILRLVQHQRPEWQQLNDAEDAARQRLREVLATADTDYRKALALTAHEVLSEVRPMGGEVLTYREGVRERVLRAMRYAETRYPTDWLHRAEDAEGKWALDLEDRGYNMTGRSKIVLSESTPSAVTGGTLDRVATHELGHSMEFALPELRAMEWAYHYRRSQVVDDDGVTRLPEPEEMWKSTPEQNRKFGREVAIRDEWHTAYTGKVYQGHARGLWEVFTTGVESLFDGSPYFDRQHPNGRVEVSGDDEFRQFILGVLGAL